MTSYEGGAFGKTEGGTTSASSTKKLKSKKKKKKKKKNVLDYGAIKMENNGMYGKLDFIRSAAELLYDI